MTTVALPRPGATYDALNEAQTRQAITQALAAQNAALSTLQKGSGATMVSLNALGGCLGADDMALIQSLDVAGAVITWSGTTLHTGVTLSHASLWAPKGTATMAPYGGASQNTSAFVLCQAASDQSVEGIIFNYGAQDLRRGSQDPNVYQSAIPVCGAVLQFKSATQTQIVRPTVRGCVIIGGVNGLSMNDAVDEVIDDVVTLQCLFNGIVVSQPSSTYSNPLQRRARITNTRGVACGGYALTIGTTNVLSPYGGSPFPTANYVIDNCYAETCGLTDYTGHNNKLGFDVPGACATGFNVRVTAKNCGGGGLEFKRTAIDPTGIIFPPNMSQNRLDVTYSGCLDLGNALQIPYETEAQIGGFSNLPNEMQDFLVTLKASYVPAKAWQPGVTYETGVDIVNCNGYNWWCLSGGTSGQITGVSSQADEFQVLQGGSGYTTGDTWSPIGGTGTAPVFTLVASGGAVTGYSAVTGGSYTVPPPMPCEGTTSGSGSGLVAIVGWSGPSPTAATATTFGPPQSQLGAPCAAWGTNNLTGTLNGTATISSVSASPVTAEISGGWYGQGYIVPGSPYATLHVTTVASGTVGSATTSTPIEGGTSAPAYQYMQQGTFILPYGVNGTTGTGGTGTYAVSISQTLGSASFPAPIGGGDLITGYGIPIGTTVASVTSSTVVMSQAATVSLVGAGFQTVGAIGGTGYTVGDILTIPGGTYTGPQAQVQVTSIGGTGTTGPVTGWVPYASGAQNPAGTGYSYTAIPYNAGYAGGWISQATQTQIPVTGGTGSGCLLNPAWGWRWVQDGTCIWGLIPLGNSTSAANAFARNAVAATGLEIEALSYADCTVYGFNLATDVLFSPRGSQAQASQYIKLRVNAVGTTQYGINFGGAINGGTASLTNIDIINPQIRVNGVPPSGSTPAAISVNGAGLTVVANILGGTMIATGAGSYGIDISPNSSPALATTASFFLAGDPIVNGVVSGLYVANNTGGTATALPNSGYFTTTGGSTNSAITVSGSGATLTGFGTITAYNGTATGPGINVASSGTSTVRAMRGSRGSTPTTAGSLGEFYNATTPTSTVTGWRCTTAGGAGSAVWTAFL